MKQQIKFHKSLDIIFDYEYNKNINHRIQDRADDQTDIFEQILEYCVEPKSKKEIMDFIGRKSTKKFTQNYLKPLLYGKKLKMTEPDKLTSKNQKYVTNIIEDEK